RRVRPNVGSSLYPSHGHAFSAVVTSATKHDGHGVPATVKIPCEQGISCARYGALAARMRSTGMLEVERAGDLKVYEGKEVWVSDWYTVTQEQIDKFADATGDHQWIHVDVERAKQEMPGGKTIAHGWLTLSLVP